MESDEEITFVAAQLATATMAHIAADRERLRKLWLGLNDTESVIRRGQLAYLESTELLAGGNGRVANGTQSAGSAPALSQIFIFSCPNRYVGA